MENLLLLLLQASARAEAVVVWELSVRVHSACPAAVGHGMVCHVAIWTHELADGTLGGPMAKPSVPKRGERGKAPRGAVRAGALWRSHFAPPQRTTTSMRPHATSTTHMAQAPMCARACARGKFHPMLGLAFTHYGLRHKILISNFQLIIRLIRSKSGALR